MAYISNKPAQGTVAAVTAGAPVLAPILPPDNCHTLIIYNPNVADALVQWVAYPAAFVAADAVVIPAGTAITLPIGAASARVSDFVVNPAPPPTYIQEFPYYDITAGAGNLYITYVNGPTA
jgi:hypothetical protein